MQLSMTDLFEKHLGKGKRTGSQVVFDCYSCKKKLHLYMNPNTGQYICHACLEKGNAITLMRRFGNSDDNPQARESNPSSFPSKAFLSSIYSSLLGGDGCSEIRTWCELRRPADSQQLAPCYSPQRVGFGIFDLFGIGDCSTNSVITPTDEHLTVTQVTGNPLLHLVREFGEAGVIKAGLAYIGFSGALCPSRCIHPGRVLIPYAESSYFRGYLKGGEPKYCGPKGVTSRDKLFGKIPFGGRLIVTEGEFKAATAHLCGFSCTSLPGMGSSHDYFASQCSYRRVKEVYIAFDSQRENMEFVDLAARSVAKKLEAFGITPHRVILPLPSGVGKVDLEDFLWGNGPEALVTLLEKSRGC